MSLFFACTMACYIASSLGYQGYVLFQKRPVYRASSMLLLVGFLCHTAAIALQYSETGHVPVQSLPETLSTFGWTVVGVFLILQIKFNLMILGALVAPLAAVSGSRQPQRQHGARAAGGTLARRRPARRVVDRARGGLCRRSRARRARLRAGLRRGGPGRRLAVLCAGRRTRDLAGRQATG